MKSRDKYTNHNILLTLIVLLGLTVAVYLSLHQTIFFSHASADLTPQEVTISNLTDNSFTVSWITTSPTFGYISYGAEASMSAQSDDRDVSGQQDRYTHHVTLKDLTPETAYSFKIGSGGTTFENQGSLYVQKTAATLPNPPGLPETVAGQVNFKDGSVPKEGIVYLAVKDGTMLTTTLDKAGRWLITVSNARAQDLSKYISLSDKDTFDVLVDTGGYGRKLQTFNFKDRDNIYQTSLKTPPSPTPLASSMVGIVRANYGRKGKNLPGDLNKDGVVNAIDLILAVKSNKL